MPISKPRLALIACLVTLLLWAFAFPASKAALPFFNVQQVVLIRYFIACLFYLILYAFGMFSLPRLKDLPALVVLGLLGVTTYQLLFVYGMGQVNGGAAALVIGCNPVVTSLLARFFLGERLTLSIWTGIVISAAGVVVIAFTKGTDGTTAGFIALMIATASIATYFTFQKPFFDRYSPLAMTSYTSFFGTLPLLIFLPEAWISLQSAPLAPIVWIAVMGIFSSGIGFILWFYALSQLRVGIVSSFLFLQPVIVSVMSWAWLGEIPATTTIAGGIVVLAGVALILKDQLRARG